ncbi:MAG: hypothetical protein HQL73_12955 [Magnetococcales bacterium]|nr:hypothetical protein [Magnetococcales bacterium]
MSRTHISPELAGSAVTFSAEEIMRFYACSIIHTLKTQEKLDNDMIADVLEMAATIHEDHPDIMTGIEWSEHGG